MSSRALAASSVYGKHQQRSVLSQSMAAHEFLPNGGLRFIVLPSLGTRAKTERLIACDPRAAFHFAQGYCRNVHALFHLPLSVICRNCYHLSCCAVGNKHAPVSL